MTDLGWENAGGETADKIIATATACRMKGHKPVDKDAKWPTGQDHQVSCDICGYLYHFDSSD